MEKTNVEHSVLNLFGLTYEQSRLMFSVEKYITEYDCDLTDHKRTTSAKTAAAKRAWAKKWEESILDYLQAANPEKEVSLLSKEELKESFLEAVKASPNQTWYYIVILECLTFVPYTPLGEDNDKDYKHCCHDDKKCDTMVKDMFAQQGVLSAETIERLNKTYVRCLNKTSGKTGKIAVGAVAVIATAALAAAVAAITAGPVAVGLFGAQFAGLHGAALTSTCLALAGGGAVAIGGHGMAGGILAIAGGGALLGLAGGGAAAGAAGLMMSSPDYTLTQAAKLETILKEVIVIAQQDVATAQKIIAEYKEQIYALSKKVAELELEDEKNKKEIKAIKTCIKYMKKSCKDAEVFTSAYEVGKNIQDQEDCEEE